MKDIQVPECLTDKRARNHYVHMVSAFYAERDAFYSGKDIQDCQIGRFCEGAVLDAALRGALDIQDPTRVKVKQVYNIGEMLKVPRV